MNNYDYPVGSDTSQAPWNQPDEEPEYRCPICGSDNLIFAKKKNSKSFFEDTECICRDCWHKDDMSEFEYEYEYEPEYEPDDF